ncbi:MAG: hypothetical protein JRK53_16765 [Deltaproteobacteria bacterium]|nr:hypothetical protein [Deltaproteobacteria bacterium]MBW1819539.1 hypothetical protein [Deltaproteobacteria bacterium]
MTSVIYMCYAQPEAMAPTLFTIKSLLVQNTIMLILMAAAALFFFRALWKKNLKQVVLFLAWIFAIVWFFNSPLFGFSEVSISPMGIRLNYGLMSFRNATVSFQTPWEIQSYMSGIRRTKRLYYLQIGDHKSMKVRGLDGVSRLEEIGGAIDRDRRTGGGKR